MFFFIDMEVQIVSIMLIRFLVGFLSVVKLGCFATPWHTCLHFKNVFKYVTIET